VSKKGFATNNDLLKNAGGGNYFQELLERIRGNSLKASNINTYRFFVPMYPVYPEKSQRFYVYT